MNKIVNNKYFSYFCNMHYEEEILEYLKNKFPEDPAIKALTKVQIRRVVKIYWNNALFRSGKGFLVNIERYCSICTRKSKKALKRL